MPEVVNPKNLFEDAEFVINFEKMSLRDRIVSYNEGTRHTTAPSKAASILSTHTQSGKRCTTFIDDFCANNYWPSSSLRRLKGKGLRSKRRTKDSNKRKARKHRLSYKNKPWERQTKFATSITKKLIQNMKRVVSLPSMIDVLVDTWRHVTKYHRMIQRQVGEQEQTKYIPDTNEIAKLWRCLLRMQEHVRELKLPHNIEFAPFFVYGRTIEDRQKDFTHRWTIRDEFDMLPLRSVRAFVNWAKPRRKRVVALYLNLKRSHIMAMMFKPVGCDSPGHIGLHKFDANATSKSETDNKMRQDHFPDISFYRNTTRIQSTTDFTCTFWCLHWVLWKSICSARFALAMQAETEPSKRRQLETSMPKVVDSFRSESYKKWAAQLKHYVCSKQAKKSGPPTRFGLLLLTDPAWLCSNKSKE